VPTINDFANRVVIVTGGASGMGAACVQEFVSRGALVVIVDRNAEGAMTVSDAS